MLATVLGILAVEFVIYFNVYRSSIGRVAVYRSKYAWILDSLAIFSGTAVAASALYTLSHPDIFTIKVSTLVFWLFFVLGSSQAIMHAIKWGIRYCCKD